ncbi:MAG: SMC-Scp complex subunit ScpB [bacterium]|jgi:segregation and condensation protein B
MEASTTLSTSSTETSAAIADLAPAEAVDVPIDGAQPEIAALAQQVEALLMSSPRPVPPTKIGQALGLITPEQPLLESAEALSTTQAPTTDAPAPKPKRARKSKPAHDPLTLIEQAVAHLNDHYTHSNRQFRIEKLAGSYRVMILAHHRKALEAFHGTQAAGRLSKAAVETLAIIAYKQPITRAKLEAIRGVACGEVLRSLLERRLITIVGRAEELGRPMLYGTTRQFLEAFGLANLKDLPAAADFATLNRG